jgi:CheY-like chemotaxis protein
MDTLKVLIVDDNVVILSMITDMIEDMGYIPIPVSTAEAAIDRLREGDVDVLLSDISLGGGLSGVELIADEQIDMPQTVVLMSGSPKPDALPSGTLYLSKPFTTRTLDLVIRG